MMMRRATILVAALAVVLFAGALSKPASADVSFSFFYSNLSPYGTWAVSGNYGQVWIPYDYEPGWNPYYDGHWVYTDYGWAWVSDYAWGAIPYHYGTWALDPSLGWIWVPGYVWAPSWVVFTSGPDYIGWAPVPPRYVVGASVSFSTFAPGHCVVVPARSFLAPRVRGYVVPGPTARVALSKTHIVNNIRIQNNVVVNHGPDPRGIERVAGRSIRPEPIERVKRIAPGGRFDAQEIRADRHARGGAPRVTAPEPARAQREPARRSTAASRYEAMPRPETARPIPPQRRPETAGQPEKVRPSQPARPPEREQARPPESTQKAAPNRPPGAQPQQGRAGSKPPSSKPPKPSKPPQKPSHDHQGGS